MKIEIPKVIMAVDIEDYAAELKGKKLHCWLNPPLKVLAEYSLIQTEMYHEEFEKNIERGKKAEGKKALEAAQDNFREMLEQKREEPIERMDPKRLEWFVQVFSQGPQDSHWTLEELIVLEEEDPGFLEWMIRTYWQKRQQHLSDKKKS